MNRPDDPPNTVITAGVVVLPSPSSGGGFGLSGWHTEGPWPLYAKQGETHLYFGYTLEELRAVADANR